MVVGAATLEAEAKSLELGGKNLGIIDNFCDVIVKSWLQCFAKCDGFGGNDVL